MGAITRPQVGGTAISNGAMGNRVGAMANRLGAMTSHVCAMGLTSLGAWMWKA
jgi:hypothetical protein